MDAFRIALYDLFKYSVAQKVVTGDRPFDMLLQTLCLTLVGLFSIWNWKDIKIRCQETWKMLRKREVFLTKENYAYYTKVMNTMEFSSKIEVTTTIDYQLYRVLRDNNYFPFVKTRSMNKIKDTFITGCFESSTVDSIVVMLDELTKKSIDVKYPIYLTKQGAVAISKTNNSHYYLWFTSIEMEDVFAKLLDSYGESRTLDQIVTGVKQHIVYPTHQTVIYPDRTFDHLITIYKPKILKMIDKFREMNSSTNNTNKRFGTYNLGFMLYGKPGTGKTTLIKALCNTLGRNGHVVDMRTIKTKGEFENIFNRGDIDKKIFIFEEFDCVQGIFDRKKENHEEQKRQLKEEQIKLLGMKASCKKGGDTSLVDKQLEKIEKSLQDLENSLTIDTILTVLDGVTEHRNRVIIATTNHIDKIDSALIREGRFDLKIKLEEFVHEETEELLIAYYGADAKKVIGEKIFPKQYTPVQLINLCRQYEKVEELVEILAKSIKLNE